jgi:hypothetical protein
VALQKRRLIMKDKFDELTRMLPTISEKPSKIEILQKVWYFRAHLYRVFAECMTTILGVFLPFHLFGLSTAQNYIRKKKLVKFILL